VIKGHLDTVFELPWRAQTDDELDLGRAEQILDEKHHGLEKIKERVLEFLAVLKLKGELKGPILCFAGTSRNRQNLPGPGDRRCHRPEVREDVGGRSDRRVRDPRAPQDLRRRDARQADPGYIQVGVNNP
jgi:ATP-dependent Lon protease